MKKELLAHVKENNNTWQIHSLEDHLQGTADVSLRLTNEFGLEKLSVIQALAHDVGKASEEFQQKIAGMSGYDPEAHIQSSVDHSTAGAQCIYEKYGEGGIPLAYAIMGHHGGLPNGLDESDSCLNKRLKKQIPDYKSFFPDIDFPMDLSPLDYVPRFSKTPPKFHFLIRMLYSVLADADFLDTEKFMSPERKLIRNKKQVCFSELKTLLDADLSKYSENSGIFGIRADILNRCRSAADSPKGIFSLTVPTGGGKTKSSAAFAIDHCIKNNLERIIYVIPYTSIISQNAGVFREIFGEDSVLEHHSNLAPELETSRNRLLSENWDVPIVVTTNIQFFESFYSNRSSSCRKLHNAANSVIIFDEAQMLPNEFMRPCLEVITELVENYGCSAVLCTATQPTLSETRYLKGSALKEVTEIIPNPKALYHALKRVKVTYIDEPLENIDIAKKAHSQQQILIVVNTRKDAREIFEHLKDLGSNETVFHLSTFMCPEHRDQVLKTIKERLTKNLPCKVVSTQLIEAGVDIDFPMVFRAVAGLDSIAQAAGRCNREGKLAHGEVYVFKSVNPPPPGHLRQSAESGEKVLQEHFKDPLGLDAITSYFEDFYWKRAGIHGMDKHNISNRLNVHPNEIDKIPFKDVARDFSIIDQSSKSIVIPYEQDGKSLIERLQRTYYFPNREDFKQAQRLSVQVFEKVHNLLVSIGAVIDARGDGQFYILSNTEMYNNYTGLSTNDPQFIESEKTVI